MSESIKTPYYLIDESLIEKNLRIIKYLKDNSGVKCLLALKCFSSWGVFPLISKYLDGTTGSSVNEVKLGHDEFGGETQSYFVAYKDDEIPIINAYADRVIFNSVHQLTNFRNKLPGKSFGIRINPGVSMSCSSLSDPCCDNSRLGVSDVEALILHMDLYDGVMFHFNCENEDFGNFAQNLKHIAENFEPILNHCSWVSLGGGISYTMPGYPVDKLAKTLKDFSIQFNVQLYLEPGEAVVQNTTSLVTSICDIVENKTNIVITDSSVECHMLDLLTYRETAKDVVLLGDNDVSGTKPYQYIISGRSCLAQDVFGEFSFHRPLQIGDTLCMKNAGGYTMVKMNWFNGVPMPSIAVKRLNGSIEIMKRFNYDNFKCNLS